MQLSDETITRKIKEQALGIFSQSFSKRYEFWTKKNILEIASQTLPKQAKKKGCPENLTEMKQKFKEKLFYEEEI